MRVIITTLLALSISACGNLNNFTPSHLDESFYVLDRKSKRLCLGETRDCRNLTLIVSSRSELTPIEKAYAQKVKGPNYPANLTHMLIYPKDKSYEATPIGTTGRYFRIPKTAKTNIAWETLSEIQNNLLNERIN